MKKTLVILSCFCIASCQKQNAPHHITERPYKVFGKKYYPQTSYNYDEIGYASWYGEKDHGKQTATGVIFNKYAMTAAHRTLPLPSVVKVTNLSNGKSVVLVVNDHGPFAKTSSRIIDVSEYAAKKLGLHYDGRAKVRVQCLKNESIASALAYKKNPYAKHSNMHYAMIDKLPYKSINGLHGNKSKTVLVSGQKSKHNDYISFNSISDRIRSIFGKYNAQKTPHTKQATQSRKSSLANRAIY